MRWIFMNACRMSDAGDEIRVEDAPAEEEVAAEAPKGKLGLEDALQVSFVNIPVISTLLHYCILASFEERTRT